MSIELAAGVSLPLSVVTSRVAVLGISGAGKALALDTSLPTVRGWTTMADIRVGEQLFDEDGRPTTVTAVHAVMVGNPCYRVVFDDGSEIVADAEHLWLTNTHASRVAGARPTSMNARAGRPQCVRRSFAEVRTTEEIARTLLIGRRDDRNHSIDNAAPLDLPDAVLPIDPYVLGVWLGDGTAVRGYVTTADVALIPLVEAAGYAVREVPSQRQENARCLNVIGLQGQLRRAGVLGCKRIPDEYLRASERQRRALLAGLMDTDGYADRTKSFCYFYNTNEALAEAVAELVCSLGWKARRRTKRAVLDGRDYGPCFEIGFRPTTQVFRLARKADRLRFDTSQQQRFRHRMITSVEPVESVPVRCIAVDAPSHLYLAGRSFIPTHNTYTALKITEQLLGARQQVVVFDPGGVAWGLRAGADGDPAGGLPVVILGGEHGDAPLELDAGAVIADLVVDEGLSLVLDLSDFESDAAQQRFATGFAQRLYRRKARHRDPLHLVIDESDEFAPQRAMPDQARMLGAFQTLARRGRQRGIGCTFVTQRPAEFHKSCLTQCSILIALRMMGSQDVKAIDDWIRHHHADEHRAALMESISALGDGEAWFWSPPARLFARARVTARATFDSSSTPAPGRRAREPRGLTDVDLEALQRRMSATVERAREADPAHWRALLQSAREEAAVARQAAADDRRVEAVAQALVEAEAEPVAAHLTDAQARLEKALTSPLAQAPALISEAATRVEAAAAAQERAGRYLATARAALDSLNGARPVQRGGYESPRADLIAAGLLEVADPTPAQRARGASPSARGPDGTADASLDRCQRAILTVLLQEEPHGCGRRQLALLAGYRWSGGFRNALSALRTRGLLSGSNNDVMRATVEARAHLTHASPRPRGQDLLAWWRAHEAFGACERAIIDQLVAFGQAESGKALARSLGREYSGGFRNALSALRTAGVIVGRNGGPLSLAKELRA